MDLALDISAAMTLFSSLRFYEYDKAEKRLTECLQLYDQHQMANYYLAMTMKITGNEQ